MGQSVTGTGAGSAEKVTSKELATLANAPSILIAGRVTVEDGGAPLSPPSPGVIITLDPPLPGSHTNYVVIATGLNSGAIYVSNMTNNADGDFYRFYIVTEEEGAVMYFVTKAGIRPVI